MGVGTSTQPDLPFAIGLLRALVLESMPAELHKAMQHHTYGLDPRHTLFVDVGLSDTAKPFVIPIVHTLSPSATAFGGNFNKAALVFLTLLLPFLRVNDNPPSPWIEIIWLAVICNIAAFSYYSYLQILAKKQKEEEEKRKAGKLQDESSGEEEDDGSSSSSSDSKGMC